MKFGKKLVIVSNNDWIVNLYLIKNIKKLKKRSYVKKKKKKKTKKIFPVYFLISNFD